jgi:CDP-diacylglycerol--glycerol-3-phosphate 3-phosphatidyltransferase
MNVIPQVVKDGFVRLVGPLARALIRAGIRPNVITTVGTMIVVGSGVAFGMGHVRLGGLLLLASGVFDILDGEVARQGGMMTTFGAFYDSTLDRVGEAAVFAGLAIYFERGGVPAERQTLALAIALTGLAMSMLVSYARARAEGLGLECKVGWFERPERMVLVIVMGLAGIGPVIPAGLLILTTFSFATAGQRMAHVWKLTRAAGSESDSTEA